MEIRKFMASVKEKILAAGLKKNNECLFQNSFVLHDKDTWITNVPGYDFTCYNGCDLELDEVWRRNATAANVSVRISITQWDHSNGHTLKSVKISCKDSKNKQDRLINEIVNYYIELESRGK